MVTDEIRGIKITMTDIRRYQGKRFSEVQFFIIVTFVTVTDGFWFIGYGFLSIHLFTIIKSLRRSSNTNNVINRKFVIVGSFIIAVVFAIFNGFNLMSQYS